MYVADGLRVVGLIAVIVAAAGWGSTETGIMVLVLVGLVSSRFLDAAPAFDIGLSVILLVAGWSSVIDLYGTIPSWDLVIHFAAGGAVAAAIHLLLVVTGLLPQPSRSPLVTVLILTTCFGLAAGTIWEFMEWASHTYIDERVFVGYDDTIGDMALGGLGAFAAGFGLKYAGGSSRHT